MENKELLIGKTISDVILKEDDDEIKLILSFTDGTVAIIRSDASSFLYSLFIQRG